MDDAMSLQMGSTVQGTRYNVSLEEINLGQHKMREWSLMCITDRFICG